MQIRRFLSDENSLSAIQSKLTLKDELLLGTDGKHRPPWTTKHTSCEAPLPVESNRKIRMKTRVFERLMIWMWLPLAGTKHDSLYWDILLSSSIFRYFFQLAVGKWRNRQYLSLGPQPFIFWFHLHCRGPGDQTVRAHMSLLINL